MRVCAPLSVPDLSEIMLRSVPSSYNVAPYSLDTFLLSLSLLIHSSPGRSWQHMLNTYGPRSKHRKTVKQARLGPAGVCSELGDGGGRSFETRT